MAPSKYAEHYAAKLKELRQSRSTDKSRAYARDYAARNPHKQWESRYRTRARSYDLPVVVESFTKEELVAHWGNGERCIYCDGPFEQTDHMIPIANGGPHTLANVVPSCRACNGKSKPQIRHVSNCEQCGDEMPNLGYGRVRRYCTDACRQKGYRVRAAARGMPPRMTSERRWVRADGKRPVMVDGSPASSTDPSTWASWAEVQSGQGDGFGVMLGDGLGCWDLDDCLDGDRLAPWAAEILDEADPLHVERSVSGRGLHIFVDAVEGPGSRRGNVEFYSRGRFIRVTGDTYRG